MFNLNAKAISTLAEEVAAAVAKWEYYAEQSGVIEAEMASVKKRIRV